MQILIRSMMRMHHRWLIMVRLWLIVVKLTRVLLVGWGVVQRLVGLVVVHGTGVRLPLPRRIFCQI